MNDCPFNADLLELILRGEAFPEAPRRLRAHLEHDCPDCDKFFSGLDPDDEEILMLRVLAQADAGKTLPNLSEESRSSIMEATRRVWPSEHTSKQPLREGRSSRRALLQLAASFVVMMGAYFLLTHWGWITGDGTTNKGDEIRVNGSRVYLQFVVRPHEDGKDPAGDLIRGVNRGVYSKDQEILFRYEVKRPARVYITRMIGANESELIYPGEGDPDPIREPGVHVANQGDEVLIYSLDGLDGLQTFCALTRGVDEVSRKELLQRAATEVERNWDQMEMTRLRRDWMDCFQIKVEQR